MLAIILRTLGGVFTSLAFVLQWYCPAEILSHSISIVAAIFAAIAWKRCGAYGSTDAQQQNQCQTRF
jgi:hypothetical protein